MRVQSFATRRPADLLAVVILVLAAAFAFVGPARAQIENAPLLVADLDSGAVIFERNATMPWYPASLTKMMTAYVALDAVRSGHASMNTLLTVSAQAASMPPSKMGFRPGSQITLENALRIIMVKSANDVAWTIAENIGGSAGAFVTRMNATARRLGMNETVFANPSGLPDLSKRTTARDMALLAQALIRDFPSQRGLWGMQAIAYGNTVMNNHNGIIGRYAGATGMKTGYVCSSGFNVVATAERNGRRLVAVVMGQMSSRERTALTASLLEYGFQSRGLFGLGTTGRSLTSLPRSAVSTPPDLRPIVCDPNRRRGGESDDDTQAIVVAAGAPGGSGALAFFAAQARTLPTVDLPARQPVEPVRVFLGLPEGVSAAPQVASAAAVEPPPLGAGLPLNILPPRRGGPLIPGLPSTSEPAPAAEIRIITPMPPRRPVF
ncbi:D-alanyl-D-alanine carboxypeptidase family protein [Salinarimonas ramus]|uniref:Penicillin-binding protein n=1 Tax=Salinarimonas ramus TaxID=690164 RepID=A0A917V8J2_9HYPH|nr:D-alanyl-D-alanine carboxypeptidase family protein [Salinarimonas ramus]GGK50389.1 penicillin-binding protein [Salinarimonas ramus]